MQTTKLACPLCHSVFATAHASPLGKSLRCQSCGAPFTVGAGDICEIQSSSQPASGAQNDEPWWVQQQTSGATAKGVSKPTPSTTNKAQVAATAAPARDIKPAPGRPAMAARGTMAQISSASGKSRAIVVVGVVGGLTLLLAAGVVLAVISLNGEPDQPTVAQAPETLPQREVVQPPKAAQRARVEDPEPQPPPQEQPPPPELPKQQQPPEPPSAKDVPKNGGPKPAEPPRPQAVFKHGVTLDQQKQIDSAIDRGVTFLKGLQNKDGSWAGFDETKAPKGLGKGPGPGPGKAYRVGPTALVALTLLECGVPRDDPRLVKTANILRNVITWKDMTQTYELALTVLFLDRLGEKKDKLIIQALALPSSKAKIKMAGGAITARR